MLNRQIKIQIRQILNSSVHFYEKRAFFLFMNSFNWTVLLKEEVKQKELMAQMFDLILTKLTKKENEKFTKYF